MSVRVPDERLDELAASAQQAIDAPPVHYAPGYPPYAVEGVLWVALPPLDVPVPPRELAALVADLRDARADNQRIREAFGAYRSALLSGEPESEQMRALARSALAEEPRA